MRRILVIAIVLAALGAASVAGFGLLNYEPLAQGSTSYGGDPHVLLATTEDDETTAYHFRYAPSGSFTTAFSVRNDGPVAVTLLGADLHDETEATLAETAVLWPQQLSIAMPDPLGEWTDSNTAPPIDHAVIQPGSELILGFAGGSAARANPVRRRRTLPVPLSAWGRRSTSAGRSSRSRGAARSTWATRSGPTTRPRIR